MAIRMRALASSSNRTFVPGRNSRHIFRAVPDARNMLISRQVADLCHNCAADSRHKVLNILTRFCWLFGYSDSRGIQSLRSINPVGSREYVLSKWDKIFVVLAWETPVYNVRDISIQIIWMKSG